MVKTFGDNLVSVYTSGDPVEAIYANGVKVWPNSTPSSEYYIKWWPKDASSYFTIGGEMRYLQSYSGYYSGPFLSSSFGFSSKYYYMDANAFSGVSTIVAIETNLPVIRIRAFQDCTSLKWVSAPDCFYINNNGAYAFTPICINCPSLTTAYFPKLSRVNAYTFVDCYALRDVNIEDCIVLGGDTAAFVNCSGLYDISLPNCQVIDDYAFENCNHLEDVYLGPCTKIGSSTFLSCPNLKRITITYSGVCTGLLSTLWKYKPSVYVPLEWLSDYWSRYPDFKSLFHPIS